MSAGRRQALIAVALVLAACGKGDLSITGTGEAATEAQVIAPYPAKGAVRLPEALAGLDLEGPLERARTVAGDLWVASHSDRPGFRPLPRARGIGARVGEVFDYPYVALRFEDDVRERATIAWGEPATCAGNGPTNTMWRDPEARIRAWTTGLEKRTLVVSAYTPIPSLLVDPQSFPAGRPRILGEHRDALERNYGPRLSAITNEGARIQLPATEWGGGEPLRLDVRFDDDRVTRVSFELVVRACSPTANEDFLGMFARAWGEPRRRDKQLVYWTPSNSKIVIEPDRGSFDIRIEL